MSRRDALNRRFRSKERHLIIKALKVKMSREIVIRKEAGEKLGVDLETYHTQYNKPHVS